MVKNCTIIIKETSIPQNRDINLLTGVLGLGIGTRIRIFIIRRITILKTTTKIIKDMGHMVTNRTRTPTHTKTIIINLETNGTNETSAIKPTDAQNQL